MYCSVVENLGPKSVDFLPNFLDPMMKGLSSENMSLRQGAAYLVGALAKYGKGVFEVFVADAIPGLLTVLKDPDSYQQQSRVRGATENAAAAALYIARFLPNAGLGMAEALELLLPLLPFFDDLDEANSVYEVLSELLRDPTANDYFNSENLAVLFTAFAEVVLGEKAFFADGDEEANGCTDTVRSAVEHVRTDGPDIFCAALVLMDADARKSFIERFEVPGYAPISV
jgi:hypothetical protein